MRASLWLVLLAACASSSASEERRARPATKTVEQTVLQVERISKLPEDETPVGLALSVRHDTLAAPQRLARDFAQGRTWLHLRHPRGFSFAIHDLLEREDVFVPTEALLTFAQQRTASRTPRREPALLRLSGVIHGDDIAPHLEVVPDPGFPIEGLGSIENQDVRVLLGRGIDHLLEMAPPAAGGTEEYDTREWVAVVGAEGDVVKLSHALAEARQAVSLLPLRSYRVLVRRWRPRARDRATFFRVRLEHVLLAAQMAVAPRGNSFRWDWEGIWEARMETAPARIQPPDWNDPPTLRVNYKEYKESRSSRVFWESLMSPLALGADVGKALFEGESVVDRVTRRQ
ncbi:MAG: hypothetical protein ACYTEZ_14585 [Planctomycetota bacterium]|jgi:hypothetical protein